jgi:L-fuculose-phosphate aldolase
MTSSLHPRDELLEAMERIYRYRMTTTSGGNLSIREPNGDVWITPARIDKGGLRREDIVLVRPDGSIEGVRNPSSELPLHQAIYRARPDVRGIVHAHPVALVAFSLVHDVPDTRVFHQSWHVCGSGGFAPYELPGSEKLGETVSATFARGFDCVILENHGVVTSGSELQEAFRRFETFEFAGKTIIKARLLGGEIRYLRPEDMEISERRGETLPEFHRAPPGSAEKELRRRICEFARRAYRQRLFISTQGTFSARIDESSFLITPYRLDRGTLQPPDLVLVDRGRVEAGAGPSRAVAMHNGIYRAHPAIGAIINAYPVNATAFSITGSTIDTRTIPESYIVVRRPVMAPYGAQFNDPGAIARMLSSDHPVVILENDGVLVTGTDVLEAFDRLEVLESTAEALINSRAIGSLSPMPDDVIQELDREFLGNCRYR